MIALMSLGPVVFDLILNVDGTDSETSSAFAKHEVFGSSPVYESAGDEESTITLTGSIHPEHFGGLGNLASLEVARLAKTPMPLMRGDFMPLGWVLIQSITEKSGSINHQGIGREIVFTVKLLRVGNPGLGMAEAILRVFQ